MSKTKSAPARVRMEESACVPVVSGIAFLVAQNVARFHEGSHLYKLEPSRGMTQSTREYVVAAVTPCARDHGNIETTLFYADETGSCAPYGGLDGGAEALAPVLRVVGRDDHIQALAHLGYYSVLVEREVELREIGTREALRWASRQNGGLDRQAYAATNWGLFAAMHLRDVEKKELPFTEVARSFPQNTRTKRGSREAYLLDL